MFKVNDPYVSFSFSLLWYMQLFAICKFFNGVVCFLSIGYISFGGEFYFATKVAKARGINLQSKD